ncbi:A24 family peptidase [Litoreibacter roseus]|uniref:Prepilin type IV endopeptidase peptidase domain-containing protein n=1 Tax=Litoreibacter roseus TaxID=2601869 RepID=A0A6N6JHT9_9RHOB|nr:prepilin peptidase [Litoreibacter roseus]GFE65400.1 hypothetical protein KIN_24740 [Litoreibacter roseus]
MALDPAVAGWFLLFALPICLWAAWTDLSSMLIKNEAVLALLAVFVVIGFLTLPLPVFGQQLLHLVIVLIVTFLLTLIGLIGAGDAKFAAAIAPFVAREDIFNMMLIFSVCAIVGFLSHRLARSIGPIRRLAPNWKSWGEKETFPMGYPLGFSLIIYLLFAFFD